MALSRLRRGPSVREAWTNRGRVLRKLGEPNADRARGWRRLAAVPQSVLSGGSSESHDLRRAFHFAHRSDIHVRPATFGTSRFPSILSVSPGDCRRNNSPHNWSPSAPNTHPVDRFTKCSCAHARQVTASYVASSSSSDTSSANHPCTFRPVVGHR